MDNDFSVTIIGSNSATAAHGRFPTSQYLKLKNNHFLIDCGEGTQFRMSEFNIPKSYISKIFISHLHGDHFYGLVGLLTSYSLAKRTKTLEIYAPKGLKEIIEIQNKYSDAYFSYEIVYIETQANEKAILFEDETVRVSSFPLKHRIDTTGFLFEEKNTELKIIKEKISEYDLNVDEIVAFKNKKNLEREKGTLLNYSDFTYPESTPRSYAYCSDTLYNEDLINCIFEATMLYHEATFDNKLLQLAEKTNHSTTHQAATIAKKLNTKKLLIGHFSSRYHQLDILLNECKEIFENTEIAVEGETYSIN
jgi:ribonuclease Z